MTFEPDPSDPRVDVPKPEPITAKTLGYFNVIFGILFILETAFEAGIVLAMPSVGMLMSFASDQQQEQQARTWDARLADFAARLEDAGTNEQREVIEAERLVAELSKNAGPNWLGFSMGFLNDPALRAGAMAKLGVMLGLNGLLIASGIGLIRLRRWGRSTARLASLLLIPATIAFSVFAVGAVPGMSERWTVEMRSVLFEEADPGGLPAEVVEDLDRYERGMERLFLASLVFSGGLTLLYPVVAFVVASRPGVREATRRRTAT